MAASLLAAILPLTIAVIASVPGASPASAAPGCVVTNETTLASYSSIGSAIGAAASGNTLLVVETCPGNSTVTVPLTIVGAGAAPT